MITPEQVMRGVQDRPAIARWPQPVLTTPRYQNPDSVVIPIRARMGLSQASGWHEAFRPRSGIDYAAAPAFVRGRPAILGCDSPGCYAATLRYSLPLSHQFAVALGTSSGANLHSSIRGPTQ